MTLRTVKGPWTIIERLSKPIFTFWFREPLHCAADCIEKWLEES